MQRFYFHIGCTDETIPDYDGVNLESLDACHGHALRIISECLPHVQDDPRRWWIEVADGRDVKRLVVLYPRRVPFGSRRPTPGHVRDARYWSDFLMRVCFRRAQPNWPAVTRSG